MNQKLRNSIQNILIVLITLAIIFLMGEIISRIYCAVKWKEPTYIYRYSLNRDVFYEFNPGWEGEFGGVPIKINSWGLRDYAYPFKKNENTYRILVLGDSVTFGWKLSLEDIFQKVLEKSLNKRDSGYNYEVLNAAVPGYNLRQEVAYLESSGLKFKPNLIILGIFINDITDFNARPIRIIPQISVWSLPCHIRDIPRKSFFLQFLLLKWELITEKYNRNFNITALNDNADFLKGICNSTTNPYWSEFNKQIKKLALLAKTDNIKVMLLYWPDFKQFNKSKEYRQLQAILKDIANKNNFYFLDLLPCFENSSQWPLLSEKFPGDYHPNEVGHRLAAEAVYRYLTTNQITP